MALNQWNLFCNREKIDFFNPKNHTVLKFLTKKFKEGASYGTLNSYRSAISLISTDKIGEDPLISRLLKGIFKLKPVFPKYSFTWDVSIALNYIAKLFPLEKLSFATLTLKTVMLLSLGTAQRAQTIAGIQLKNVIVRTNEIQINILDLIKTSAPGREQPILILPFLRANPELCVASTLIKYMQVSSTLRGRTDKLFITTKKPHRAVSSQTISRWIKYTLSKSGIDTTIFSGHSTRHAATSAAHKNGISLDIIRKTAGWTAESKMFAKVYNRPIISQNSFTQAVLSKLQS